MTQIETEFDSLMKGVELETSEAFITTPFYTWIRCLRNVNEIVHITPLIQGKTGQGKTYLTANKMIPKLFKDENIKLSVVSAPNYGILNIRDFENAIDKNFADGEVAVTTNFDSARNELMLGKKVVLVTIHPRLISPAGMQFLDMMDTFAYNKYAIFIDEAHSWLVPFWTLYKDARGHNTTALHYKARLYRLLENRQTNYQFWLTATPTNVQTGKISYDGKLQCKIINKLPPKNLTIDRLAYLNSVQYYNPEISMDWIKNGADFGVTEIEKLVLAKLKEIRRFQLETGIKKTMIIRTSGTNASEWMCHPKQVRRCLDKLVLEAGYDKKDKIYGVTNQSGVTLESVSGNIECLNNDIDLQSRMDDPYDPVTIMLVIDKCYQGMSVNSLKTIVVWRVTIQEDSNGEPILDFGLQVAGRGSRPFAGNWKLENHSFDPLKSLSLEDKKMIIEANGVDVILPGTSQAREVGRILADEILCSKDEFQEYFLESSEKISTQVEDEICDHCGASSKYWNKNLVEQEEIDADKMNALLAAE